MSEEVENQNTSIVPKTPFVEGQEVTLKDGRAGKITAVLPSGNYVVKTSAEIVCTILDFLKK